jgi:phosphoribosylformylglycinamidine synthase
VKPLHGLAGHSTHGDSAVIKPIEGSMMGLAISTATNPWAVALDPYRGGKLVIDEVCRNLVAVGARPHSLTDCLNFGNPEKPEVLGMFREAVRGIGEAAAFLELPIPSGNVSFYNESQIGTVLPTPVVMGCGIVDNIETCTTSDLKKEGSSLYLIGTTQDAMAGSLYLREMKSASSKVPDTDLDILRKSIGFIMESISSGKILSCHDISDGGLAIALCEMAIGGAIGAEINVSSIEEELRDDVKLFSESPTRWLLEVSDDERLSPPEGVRAVKIGNVTGESVLIYSNEQILFESKVTEIEEKWSSRIWDIMG